MKWYQSSKVIAAVGALAAAVIALVAALSGWSAEVVALVGGVVAAVLGVWRAVAVKSKTTAAMIILFVVGAIACTPAQRRAIAITTISSSADAARCVLSCEDDVCREACAVRYGAAIARDLVAHIVTAASTGATEMSMEVPQVWTQDELDAKLHDSLMDD